VTCANAFAHALRGEQNTLPREFSLLPGAFQPNEIVRALERHAVPFIVVGDWAAASRGFDEPVMLLDVVVEASGAARQALAGALHELGADAAEVVSPKSDAREPALATCFGGLDGYFAQPAEFAALRGSAVAARVAGEAARGGCRNRRRVSLNPIGLLTFG
jgi:hypothetical protein